MQWPSNHIYYFYSYILILFLFHSKMGWVFIIFLSPSLSFSFNFTTYISSPVASLGREKKGTNAGKLGLALLDVQYSWIMYVHGNGIFSCLAQNKKDATFPCSSSLWYGCTWSWKSHTQSTISCDGCITCSFVRTIPKDFLGSYPRAQ